MSSPTKSAPKRNNETRSPSKVDDRATKRSSPAEGGPATHPGIRPNSDACSAAGTADPARRASGRRMSESRYNPPFIPSKKKKNASDNSDTGVNQPPNPTPSMMCANLTPEKKCSPLSPCLLADMPEASATTTGAPATGKTLNISDTGVKIVFLTWKNNSLTFASSAFSLG